MTVAPAPQRLFLVRHGPTHAKGMIGWTDLPADLSDTAALARLSAWLPDSARVISSDLIRASATADAIAGQRIRLPHDSDLREMHFGDWEGRKWRDLSDEDQEKSRAFYETPGDMAPPGGESWNTFCARTGAAVDRYLAQDGSDLIVVCHFGVILSQLQRATRQSAYETFAQKVDNLSVTEIIVTGETWDSREINHCP